MSQEINKKQLERITEICQDGCDGYQTAATHLQDQDLKTTFNRLSQQRKLFSEELIEDARSLGYQLENSGSVQGYFHRAWIEVKDAFTVAGNAPIIETSLTGEHKAKEVYEDVLKVETLPAFIQDRLNEQLGLINSVIFQLEELKDHID